MLERKTEIFITKNRNFLVPYIFIYKVKNEYDRIANSFSMFERGWYEDV